MEFKFHSPVKVYFGHGARKKLSDNARVYGEKCLIVRTPAKSYKREIYFNEIVKDLESNGIQYVLFDQVQSNPAIEIIDRGAKLAREEKVDFIIGFGGGSSLDTAKAIALKAENPDYTWEYCFRELSNPFEDNDKTTIALPVLAVTTTSGTGSHVTQASVVSDTKNHDKLTLFHSCLFPKLSIVDPELMLTMPANVTAATGFDALSHAVESYFNPKATLLTEALSLQAITIITETLPELIQDLENPVLREKMAYADSLAGICLSNAGAEAPHPIGEIINGYYPELTHGETLALVYPAYLEYVSTIIPEKAETLLAVFEKAGHQGSGSPLGLQMSSALKNFLHSVNFNVTASSLNLNEAVIKEIEGKLKFDLPLTDAVNMRKIFVDSIR